MFGLDDLFYTIHGALSDLADGATDFFDRAIYDPIGTVTDSIEEAKRKQELEEIEREVQRDKPKKSEDEAKGVVAELLEICNETAGAFLELFTIGAYEILVKGNTEWQTSYDTMEEVDRIVCEARETYEKSYNKTKKKLTDLSANITASNEKKKRVADRLNKQLETEKIQFNSVPKMVSQPYLQSVPKVNYLNLAPLNYVGMSLINPVKSFGFVDISVAVTADVLNGIKRVKIANENLEDAKDFRIRVNKKVAEFEVIQNKILAAEFCLKEENAVLDALLSINITAKDCADIFDRFRLLLAESILDDKGALNQVYKDAIQDLKSILMYN